MLRLKHFGKERSARRGVGERRERGVGEREKEEKRLQQSREILSMEKYQISNIHGIHPFQLNKIFLLTMPF
jgi:hypothetical protein